MDEQKQQHLKEHYAASEWLGRQGTEGAIEDVELTESVISGWTRVRAKRHDLRDPPFFHSVWQNSSNAGEIITIRITECADASAAQHQLLEELGTFHSFAVKRRDGADTIGDVSFGLAETMALFTRANVVVTILNAGPQPVSVVAVARAADIFIQQKVATRANGRESYYGAFGWRPSMPDPRDIVADSDAIQILAEVDPRGTYMPPIYDQGRLNSCTANAVAASIDADRLADGQGAMNPSRLAIYWFERYLGHQSATADAGAMGRDGFKAARNFGVIPESDWPYTDNASDPRFAEDPRTGTNWNDSHWVLDDKYKTVRRSLIDFKRVLSNKQTIAFGFAVFSSFVSQEVASTGIVPSPDPSQIIPNEGHSVLAIGYLQDHPDYCLCRNSWGISWGMDGYFLMPWSVLLDPSFSGDFRTIYRPLG